MNRKIEKIPGLLWLGVVFMVLYILAQYMGW